MPKRVKATEAPNVSAIASPELLGQLIKAKRTGMKLKLRDCAALCGVGINTLSRLERGNPNTTLAATFSVLQGLGIQLTAKADASTEEWV
ncbi:UNVERIFIED_ORG: helix-turn-helix protein [Idiomarina abyssalis]|jgi:transcriptional regulator with XRE-family HTH domain|uniref:helix-turn-helix domain-containing protein n=1 Tax=Idiomarina sp. 017G TaxID=2183988 RepID=UPI000E0F1F95|nr:helix-turn-helix domain-containing protein [Idiomarina sp. 017G]NWO07053.1 helix-turn-helix domain-containing protein [Alteromonadaceae bacterium]TDO50207.1 helix-turn-helix protein [Idiomarina sp. 017G]